VVAGRVPERVAAAMSFHGGGLATDDPGSPHLLADQIRAAVYVGGAENDASFTPESAETLDKALTAADVEHTIEWYTAAHGFAVSDHRAVYDPDAAERHWKAMETFFGAKLG
jgi:carboxymethylenebutenolidase